MKKVILIISILFTNLTISQVKFEANVSKETLGINENLRVDFKMNKDGDNFTPPNFSGFDVVGGPNQSVSNSWINGVRSFSKTYTYFLTPIKRGRFTIGQASIEIEGDIYKTSTVDILVTEAVSSSLSPNNPDTIVSDDLELIAEVSKRSPYLNEPISVVYKLLFSPKINVTNLSEVDAPDFKNFWSQNIKIPRLEINRTSHNGKSYNYVTWKKMLLYPQKAGDIDIDPMTLDVTIDVPTNRRDFFGNVIYSQTSNKVSSEKVKIITKPFPEENKPEEFNGAVGDFKIFAESNKSELSSNESFQVELKITGSGNLKLFSIPELVVPSSLEKYDPEFNENVKVGLSGMNGSISNTYTIVPQFQGKYPIPSTEFVYFNPREKKYIKILSEELVVNILDGPTSSITANTNDLSNSTKNILNSKGQFNFIELETNLFEITKKQSVIDQYFKYIIILIFLFLLFSVLFIKFILFKKSKSIDNNKIANRMAVKSLENAKKYLSEKELFYETLEKCITVFLVTKFDFKNTDLVSESINKKLSKIGVDKNTTDDLINILNTCQYFKFTPNSEFDTTNDYNKSVEIIMNLQNFKL